MSLLPPPTNIEVALSVVQTIASVIGTIFIVLTLREAIMQRRSSYMPDIVIPKKQLTMRWSGGKSSTPSLWDTSGSDDFNVTEDEMRLNPQLHSYQCFLDVMNIGLEAAKDVAIDWDIPLQQLVSLIKAADVNGILDISLGKNVLELNVNMLGVHSVHSLNQKEKIDYVLPLNDTSHTNQVTLPSSYTSLCSAILLLSALNNEKFDALYTEIPKIIALLRYRDIGGKTISKKFSVLPKFSVLFMPTDVNFGQTVSAAGTSFAVGVIEVEPLYDSSPTDGLNGWLTQLFVLKDQMVTLLKQVKNQIRMIKSDRH